MKLKILIYSIFQILAVHGAANFYKCYDTTDQKICFQVNTTREVGQLKTWTDANALCLGNKSTLPTIKNQAVQSIFESFIEDADLPNDQIWLNGKGTYMGGWFWLSGSSQSTPPSQPTFSASLPVATLIVNQTASYSQESPFNILHPFICQYKVGSSSCQSSGGISVGGSCFVVRETTLDWFTARSRCKATDDGDLASFDGSFDYFNSTWPTNGQKYWVGLRQYSWNWTDTSEIVYSRFERTADNNQETCMSISYQGIWSSEKPCNNPDGFALRIVCQTVLTVYPKSTLAPDSSQYTDVCLNTLTLGLIIAGIVVFIILTVIIVAIIVHRRSRSAHVKSEDNGTAMTSVTTGNAYTRTEVCRSKSIFPNSEPPPTSNGGLDRQLSAGYDQHEDDDDVYDEFDDNYDNSRVSRIDGNRGNVNTTQHANGVGRGTASEYANKDELDQKRLDQKREYINMSRGRPRNK